YALPNRRDLWASPVASGAPSDVPLPRDEPRHDALEQAQGQTPQHVAVAERDAVDDARLRPARRHDGLLPAGGRIGELAGERRHDRGDLPVREPPAPLAADACE